VAVRPIRIYGDPVLRRPADPVKAFDESLRGLLADLFETMHAYRGIGLAAPQIGVSQRVFVLDVPMEEGRHERFAVINPVLDERKGKRSGEEGCLSMPGILEEITRADSLRLRGVDPEGRPFERRVQGFLAVAIQHEADHLDGVLFTDRLSPLRRRLLRRELDALARGEIPAGYHPGRGDGEGLI